MFGKRILQLETLVLVLIAAAFSSFLVWYYNHNPFQKNYIVTPIVEEGEQPTSTPTVTPSPQVEKTSQISPDGNEVVAMKITHNPDKTLSYVVTTAEADGSDERQIYATSSAQLNLQIPFNTWSPDDKFLFIQKDENDAWVFRASGEPMSTEQPYLEVATPFIENFPTDIISEVTGWAAPELLIVNSLTPEGKVGSSFWYEVPSQAITRLSTRF